MSQQFKSPVEQANTMVKRVHPQDIVEGFKKLGYNDVDIDRQFDFHQQDLGDGNEPGLNDVGEPITDEQVYRYMRSHLEDGGILPKFQPTKETIWNDPKHPLYGIGPSEQNPEFLKSAIAELTRNLQSPAHFKFYAGNSGGTMAQAKKQLAQYKKALDYIKNYGRK